MPASAPSATIARIAQTTRAVRPGREAGPAGSVRIALPRRRAAGRAIRAGPAEAAAIVVESRTTVGAGWMRAFAPGACAALWEALGSRREFAARNASGKDALTLSISLRTAAIDG